MLTEMLGVPTEHGRRIRAWADDILAFQGVNRPSEAVLDRAQTALVDARAYLADLIARRRREPGSDLLSLMTGATGGESLTDTEIINTGITLLTAGHETTTSLIGNGLLSLLTDRSRWAALGSDPHLLPDAIEEILRYESPVSRQPRLLTRDVELRGQRLRAGADGVPDTRRGQSGPRPVSRSGPFQPPPHTPTGTSRSGTASISASAHHWPGPRP